MNLTSVMRALGAALAVALLAVACGGSGDDRIEIPAAPTAPVPAPEPAPAPPEPSETPAPPAAAEGPEPPAPPEPAAAAEEPEPPAPPGPPTMVEEPEPLVAEPPEPPDPPSVASESPEVPGDQLSAEEVAALATRLEEARSNLTSSQSLIFMSLRMSFPGEPDVAADDVPLGNATQVGDRVRVEMDTMALMAGILGGAAEDVDPGLASLPPLEMIVDGDTQIYMRLAMLAAIDPAGQQPPWLQELAAEHGDDVGELWGFVDVSDHSPEVLAALGLDLPLGVLGDVLGPLAAGAAEGALLEANRGGRTQVAGDETEEYSFLLDLAALSELPELVGGLLGGTAGGLAAPPDDFLGGLSGPLPIEYTIHVDGDDHIRRVVVAFDMGEFFAALLGGFGESEEMPDGAETGLPDFEFLVSNRVDTVAVNDPSLVVELPDPSLVVDLPASFLGGGLL